MPSEALRDFELFRNLSPLHLGHLGSIQVPLELAADSVIFQPGDRAKYFYVIHDGRVRISSIMPGGGEEALAILEPRSYFGELKLVDDSGPYTVLAVAHTDCSLAAFPIRELRDLLGADRDLAASFLWSMVQTLARRLEATNEKIAAMAKLTSPV